MTLKYATTKQLAYIINQEKKIPSWEVGENPEKENIGSGNSSNTIFYLDQRNILADSYILSHGLSDTTDTALTETTDYTLDKDSGKVTLTTAGVAAVVENCIFGTYSYIGNGLTNDDLNTRLITAEREVDSICNTTFNDGTVANPTFPFILREKHPSQLIQNSFYFTKERPLIDIDSTLSSDITDSETSFDLATGDGDNFPTSGRIIIDSEIMSYSGITTDTLTGVTRGILGSTATTHLEDAEVHTTFIETSTTEGGGVPTWNVLAWNTKFTVGGLGNIYIFREHLINNIEQDVADRVRVSYYNGFDTIPLEIERLTLLFAKRQLIQDNIGQSIIAGRDEFNPEMFNVDKPEIDSIVSAYRQNGMGNT